MKSLFDNVPGNKSFDPTKVKTQAKMAQTRLNLQKNKLFNGVKTQRRALAELLAVQKYDAARMRVESCIRDDVGIEGLEVLSLFLDVIANRVNLIAEAKVVRDGNNRKDPTSACPVELKEAVTSVLWAGSRIGSGVPELDSLRKAFEAKFGRQFVEYAACNHEFSVNERMMERMSTYAPPNEKCIAYLAGIATEYGLSNFDEDKLRDPNSIVATSTGAAGGKFGEGGYNGSQPMVPGSIITSSGFVVPPLSGKLDEIDTRLRHLMCF